MSALVVAQVQSEVLATAWRTALPPDGVPLLHRAAGNLDPAASAAWEHDSVAGAWWPAAVAALEFASSIIPWDLHAQAIQQAAALGVHHVDNDAIEQLANAAQSLPRNARVFVP